MAAYNYDYYPNTGFNSISAAYIWVSEEKSGVHAHVDPNNGNFFYPGLDGTWGYSSANYFACVKHY
ncbi:hypothetical protein PT273_02110 [Orbaceae bacterium ESL0727]|nr:hypothetical protein [Orbaceae bacterium ESL0727]